MKKLIQKIRDKIRKKRHLRLRQEYEAHYGDARVAEEILREFRRLYFYTHETTWRNTWWLGHRVLKCPLDLWIYQEILFAVQPDVIIETGTYEGGSALFFAHLLDLLGKGRVLTIDIVQKDLFPQHPRIDYLHGSSVDPEMVARVRAAVRPGDAVLVVLDSNHERDHVLAELNIYSELVTPGSYLIVEDTVLTEMAPHLEAGPKEAVEAFLPGHPHFKVDDSREKYLLSFNTRGYLQRVG
ncbi:MAG: cephalosporin hydroxylase [Deltaproteobacteria bacterium]|nr:cephalosporin hydroxylase [Deltaproteobacteria bacterium]